MAPPDRIIPSNSLLDVYDVAQMLQCSPRHVSRLVRAGKLPTPILLGSLIRWERERIESWITEGCPNCGALLNQHAEETGGGGE